MTRSAASDAEPDPDAVVVTDLERGPMASRSNDRKAWRKVRRTVVEGQEETASARLASDSSSCSSVTIGNDTCRRTSLSVTLLQS